MDPIILLAWLLPTISLIVGKIFIEFFHRRDYNSICRQILINEAVHEFHEKTSSRDSELMDLEDWIEEYIQTQTERFNQSKQNQNNNK